MLGEESLGAKTVGGALAGVGAIRCAPAPFSKRFFHHPYDACVLA